MVYQQNSKESATLQPFFTLQLDIQSEKIRTVQEALETLVARESVQGYTSKTKQEVWTKCIVNNSSDNLIVVCYVSAQDLTTTEELIVSIKLEQIVWGTSVLQLHDGHLFVI